MSILIKNKDVIESYIITSARYDFNIYEQRILYRFVEMLQYLLKGKKLDQRYKCDVNMFGERTYTVPLNMFMIDKNEDGGNIYHRTKEALKALNNKAFEYETPKLWKMIRIIEMPVIFSEKDGAVYVKFVLHHEIYEALLNFAKGFRRIEFKTIMDFTSIYAMRFYELMSEQETPIFYSLEQLRLMFQLQNKYPRPYNFADRVLAVAKKELDAKSPYTFTYKPRFAASGGKGRKKIIGWTFTPIYQPKNRDPQLEQKQLAQQISWSWYLTKAEMMYLRDTFHFFDEEIKRNMDIFEAMAKYKQKDFLTWLEQVKVYAAKASNPKGYLINAMKKELKNKPEENEED